MLEIFRAMELCVLALDMNRSCGVMFLENLRWKRTKEIFLESMNYSVLLFCYCVLIPANSLTREGIKRSAKSGFFLK